MRKGRGDEWHSEYDMIPTPKQTPADRGRQADLDRRDNKRLARRMRRFEENKERRLGPYLEESDREFARLNRSLNLQTVFGVIAFGCFSVGLFLGVLWFDALVSIYKPLLVIMVVSLVLMFVFRPEADDDRRIND